MDDPDRFYLVDGHNMFYRAFHAPMANLTSPDGEPTKAVWLCTNQVLRLIKERSPSHLCVVFDGIRSKLKRREIYPGYKASRSDVDESVTKQLKRLKQILELLGVCIVTCDGYEADDAVATLACQYASDDLEVVVVSRDKDLMALLDNPRILLYDALLDEWFNAKKVQKKFGVPPKLIPEFLALKGDDADDIPGVPGFGEKSAAKYLSLYGSIRALVQNAEDLPARLQGSLLECHKSGWLDTAVRLTTLDRSISLMLSRSNLTCPAPNLKAARPIFSKLGFRRVG